MSDRRNPFVLGKPIKEPSDFYGRERELRELFESVANMQPVALVGEHRCGNTSLLYQVLHEDVQAEQLDEEERERLLFAFVNAQLAGESPESFYRRIARALRRADTEAGVDFEEEIDAFWIEDYMEDLADRDKRLVLILDEFEVLANFAASFWEWFRGLIIEYDVSIVVATRVELGEFRDEWGSGSPFFNMFRSVYVGSFEPAELQAFLSDASEACGIDLLALRGEIEALGGRFPYYVQVAASLFLEQAERAQEGSALDGPEVVEAVRREFRARTALLFEDIWPKLPEVERETLGWLALGVAPDPDERTAFRQALPSLERRGYVVEGQVFSTAFRDFVRQRIQRIELNPDTGAVHIDKRTIELPPKEYALLRFLLEKEGEVVTKDDIAAAVWPEYTMDTLGVTDAMIQKTISRLRKEIDLEDGGFHHIESIRGQGYRFQNPSVYEVLQRRDRRNGQA